MHASLRFERVVDRLRHDLAFLDQVGVDAVPDADRGVLIGPLQEANAPLHGDVGVLKRPVLRQLLEEHLRELPHPVMTSERATAVSYTHLRAHETDSYLVCRLLLEKKKQTGKTIRK